MAGDKSGIGRCQYPDGIRGEHCWSTTDKRPRECLWCGALEQPAAPVDGPTPDLVGRLVCGHDETCVDGICCECGCAYESRNEGNDTPPFLCDPCAQTLVVELRAALTAARTEAERLRTALRGEWIDRLGINDKTGFMLFECRCGHSWYDIEEMHAPGCLLAEVTP
jgi:hypothetical protein